MIAQIYQLFFQELVKYVTGMTQDRSSAEDIVQETFLRAMEHSHLLDEMDQRQCRSWLYKTARNIFIDRTRRSSHEAPWTENENEGETSDDLSRVEVMQLVCQLPEEEKVLFIRRYFEGYDSTQLGELYDLPPSTVRYRLMSARQKLQKHFPSMKGDFK